MKVKDVTFAIKRGLPNYSSVSAGMTIEVGEGEDPVEAFAKARVYCEAEAVEQSEKALEEATKMSKGVARNRAIKRHYENR